MNYNYLSIIVASNTKGVSEKHWTQLDLQHYQRYSQRNDNNIFDLEDKDEYSNSEFNHLTLYVPAKSDGLVSLTTNSIQKLIKTYINNLRYESIIFSIEEIAELWSNKEEWVQIFKSINFPVYKQSSVFIKDLFIPLSELVRVLEYSIENGRDFQDFIPPEIFELEPYGELICKVLG